MSLTLPVSLLLSLFFSVLNTSADDGLFVKDGQKIAFMGDSITQYGWEAPGGYITLVTGGLATLGVKITAIPAGISGQTSRDMVARTKDLIDTKPDWMTLSCGVNDVWHGAGGVDLEQYKKNITSIIDQVQAAGIKVVILTSTVIGEDLTNANNNKLVAYNDFLKQLAKDRHLPLADENAAFQAAIKAAAAPAGSNTITVDGVHPNYQGHKILAKTILAALGATPDQVTKAEQAWPATPQPAPGNAFGAVDQVALCWFDGKIKWGKIGTIDAKGVESPWLDGAVPPETPDSSDGPYRFVAENLSGGTFRDWQANRVLPIKLGDKLFVYVFLDPTDPPFEIMLQLHTHDTYANRAFWGTINKITHMDPVRIGPLPETGKWVRLEVDPSQVGHTGVFYPPQ